MQAPPLIPASTAGPGLWRAEQKGLLKELSESEDKQAYHKSRTHGNLGTPSNRLSPSALSPSSLPLAINNRRKHP